jgi:glycosyl transferase family 87
MAAPPAGASAGTSTGLPAAFRTPNVRRVVVGAAVLGAVLGIQTLVLHLATDPLADIHAYYDAGARLNAGQPLYVQGVGTNEAAFYRYPPLLAIVFRPLALLPFEAAAVIWEVALLALFTLTILRVGAGRRTWIVLGMLALPTAWSLAIGQAQVAVTFLMALGSPWALAVATNVKVLPALAAIWWIGRRDLRSLGWFALWICGLGLLQLLLEPDGTLVYPFFLGLDQVGEVNNRSLYAFSPAVWAAAVVVGFVVAWRLAPTRYGWAAAVALSVLSTPRLLIYQLSTLVAALREPDRPPLRAAERAGGVDR